MFELKNQHGNEIIDDLENIVRIIILKVSQI